MMHGGPAAAAQDQFGLINPGDAANDRVISDTYMAMQMRLDSYRQSVGALFIGVVAGVFAFDTVYVQMLAFVGSAKDRSFIEAFVNFACFFAIVLAVISCYIIWRMGRHFRDITAIVHRIEQARRAFDRDAYVQGDALLPEEFRKPQRSWSDPMIDMFLGAAIMVGLANVVVVILAGISAFHASAQLR